MLSKQAAWLSSLPSLQLSHRQGRIIHEAGEAEASGPGLSGFALSWSTKLTYTSGPVSTGMVSICLSVCLSVHAKKTLKKYWSEISVRMCVTVKLMNPRSYQILPTYDDVGLSSFELKLKNLGTFAEPSWRHWQWRHRCSPNAVRYTAIIENGWANVRIKNVRKPNDFES